jgi:hypothetical protein
LLANIGATTRPCGQVRGARHVVSTSRNKAMRSGVNLHVEAASRLDFGIGPALASARLHILDARGEHNVARRLYVHGNILLKRGTQRIARWTRRVSVYMSNRAILSSRTCQRCAKGARIGLLVALATPA